MPASLLAAVFELAAREIMPLPAAVNLVSANPGCAWAWMTAAVLMPGRRADMVRVHHMDDIPLVRNVWRQGRAGVPMRGTLIYVMGPSGSGKDSLLSALRAPAARPAGSLCPALHQPSGLRRREQHMALSAGSILSMEAQGRLAMRWSSFRRRKIGTQRF